MAKKEYDWGADGPPLIAAHSLAKHRILREYIRRYIAVLTARMGQDTLRVSFIDGFSGGGEYRHHSTKELCPGSPLILLESARLAQLEINQARTKPLHVDARFIFVEKQREVYEYLLNLLTQRGELPRSDGAIRLINSEFEPSLDRIIADVKSRGRAWRAVFVLDQYGYTGVPLTALARIFEELPNAEVFLTIAVGWITAYLPNARSAAEKLGFPKDLIDRICAPLMENSDTPASTRSFDLFAIQRLLHDAFTLASGAQYYTPFFITSRDSNRPYWFLHLANSIRATDVVKELHWEINNHFEHFGAEGLLMLGYDPREGTSGQRQQSFCFDHGAAAQTHAKLITELPPRLRLVHPSGVEFGKLFKLLTNETTATRNQLSSAIRDLCIEGEVHKRGARGERRDSRTLPRDDDIVRPSSQSTLFR